MTPAAALCTAALVLLSADVQAGFRCSDASGRVFVVSRPFGGAAGVHCKASGSGGFKALPDAAGGWPVASPITTRGGFTLLTASGSGRLPASRGTAAGLRLAPLGGSDAGPASAAAPALQRMIDDVAREHGHDAGLLRAIIHVESRFNANAVSPKGAIGLMQVMPATAARMGLREPARALFDPAANIDTGARYLRLLLDLFVGRVDLAVAAYNAGEGAVLRYKRQVPPYPETRAYVRNVMALYESSLARPR